MNPDNLKQPPQSGTTEQSEGYEQAQSSKTNIISGAQKTVIQPIHPDIKPDGNASSIPVAANTIQDTGLVNSADFHEPTDQNIPSNTNVLTPQQDKPVKNKIIRRIFVIGAVILVVGAGIFIAKDKNVASVLSNSNITECYTVEAPKGYTLESGSKGRDLEDGAVDCSLSSPAPEYAINIGYVVNQGSKLREDESIAKRYKDQGCKVDSKNVEEGVYSVEISSCPNSPNDSTKYYFLAGSNTKLGDYRNSKYATIFIQAHLKTKGADALADEIYASIKPPN